MRPVVFAAGGRRRRMARASIVLPEPDSPTMPSARPGASARSTPRTARNGPRSVASSTLRLPTSSKGAAVTRRRGAVRGIALFALFLFPPRVRHVHGIAVLLVHAHERRLGDREVAILQTPDPRHVLVQDARDLAVVRDALLPIAIGARIVQKVVHFGIRIARGVDGAAGVEIGIELRVGVCRIDDAPAADLEGVLKRLRDEGRLIDGIDRDAYTHRAPEFLEDLAERHAARLRRHHEAEPNGRAMLLEKCFGL